ncbi:hypothetical protein [Melissospora conviva]|uniref:hypothetical protein n=1 Tax=Melissospora conviva TaxID=3388432 RepID=UPI003B771307
MAWTAQRLDPDRSRRRIQLLAQLAGTKALCEQRPRRLRTEQLRQLIATRRRIAG